MIKKYHLGGTKRWKVLFEQRKQPTRHGFTKRWLFFAFVVRWSAKVRSIHGERVQTASLAEFRHKLDSNYWQTDKVFWKTISSLRPPKNLILLDPSKTKEGHPWQMERVFQRSLHLVTITPLDTHQVHLGGKYHHCSGSHPSCQNAEGWESCRMWWNLTWNTQSL